MTSARELSSRLHDLLRREQSALADFLLALAEFDANRRWQELGYTSLFHYLHRELGMSKGAAHYRKTAAELVRRVPEVVEPLREGLLCITSIIELAKVLTPENREEVLPRFFHRSRQEAKAVSAELRPAEAAPHRTVMTAMPNLASARAP
ncbi:MAG TPA: HNH endonuclease, partial [Anaeromyxobacteraceae bacterium]|nr:HNH endonuclease [Anaeromyxobacteraceae bacterium]